MNKIQYIELLKLRGISNLKLGETIAYAIANSGGNPTIEEMALVNQKAMKFYIQKFKESQLESYDLRKNLNLVNDENFQLKNQIENLKSILNEDFESY